jgi:hypothetical protein
MFEISTRDKFARNDGKSNLRSSDLDDKPAHSQSGIFNNRRIPNKGAHLGVLGPIERSPRGCKLKNTINGAFLPN